MRNLLPLLPMFAMLALAASLDWRARRIPNWLTLGLAAGGLVNSLFPATRLAGPDQALLGAGLGLALTFPMFWLGAIRGGDVKLIAALGAWLGPIGVIKLLVVQALVGLVIVLVQCAARGKLTALLSNSAVLAMNVAHVRELGADHVGQAGQAYRSIDRPLPYAVPVLLAAVIVVGALM
ncbi:A24 family peptidase [Fontivita pretiosa]|uniref:A24 family peptidase n=1 Tax=Fontivita pretiosa TaxID=2989684 RepID=UPI003D177223